MAYVPVPKDLNTVKTKVLFNLTKRQLICFGGGALIGVPLFFLIKGKAGSSTAAIIMITAMLPCFLFALYQKNGQPLEKFLKYVIRSCFLRPKQRPYATNNFYAVVERQIELNDEVKRIIARSKREHGAKAHKRKTEVNKFVFSRKIEPHGKKADRGCNKKS